MSLYNETVLTPPRPRVLSHFVLSLIGGGGLPLAGHVVAFR